MADSCKTAPESQFMIKPDINVQLDRGCGFVGEESSSTLS